LSETPSWWLPTPRVTAGFFVAHRRGKKVFPLARHAAITIAGRVADAQTLIDIVKANINYYQVIRGEPCPSMQ
jgi:proteasome beta subunit